MISSSWQRAAARVVLPKPPAPVRAVVIATGSEVSLALEAGRTLADGGRELDMVVNVSQVLSGAWDYVRNDIKGVVEAAHAAGAKVKVIFENCYLKDEHKIKLAGSIDNFNRFKEAANTKGPITVGDYKG